MKSGTKPCLSSYEKLKRENEKLKQDIYNLVRNADKADGVETRLRYELDYSTNDAVWLGDSSIKANQYNGILGILQQ